MCFVGQLEELKMELSAFVCTVYHSRCTFCTSSHTKIFENSATISAKKALAIAEFSKIFI